MTSIAEPSTSASRASAASSLSPSLERQPEALILERVRELVREHHLARARPGVVPLTIRSRFERGS